LSASVTMALASESFFLNLVNDFDFVTGVLGGGVLLSSLCNLRRLWATWCLMCSCSGRGNGFNAASASRARLLSQCLSLWCRLYLRPLFNSAISSMVKEMLVLFMTLGKKWWKVFGMSDCDLVRFLIFSSRCLYFDSIIRLRSLFMDRRMKSQRLPHSLAPCRWRW